jgi:hypothetical protein
MVWSKPGGGIAAARSRRADNSGVRGRQSQRPRERARRATEAAAKNRSRSRIALRRCARLSGVDEVHQRLCGLLQPIRTGDELLRVGQVDSVQLDPPADDSRFDGVTPVPGADEPAPAPGRSL